MTVPPDSKPSPSFVRRNWQRLAIVGIVTVVITTGAVAFTKDDKPTTLTIVKDDSTTSTNVPVNATNTSSPSTSPTTAAAAAVTTVTTKSCKNSFDSSCGAQEWT